MLRVKTAHFFFLGRNCRYSCHCANPEYNCQMGGDQGEGGCSQCSSIHSIAPGKCQRKNIARAKTTTQRTTMTVYSSSNGNDGNTTTCSRTSYTPGTSNWWQVDLGSIHSIKWMDYSTKKGPKCYDYDTRSIRTNCKTVIKGFTIYVSNTSMVIGSTSIPDDAVTCYTDKTLSATSPNPIHIECTDVIVGRYVIIALPGENRIHVCELEVFECEDYTFGRECDKECNCVNDTEVCDKVTGACPISGCMVGYTGTDCLSECPLGRFGPRCILRCHCAGDDCHRATGACDPVGCAPGWASGSGLTNCQLSCGDKRFGDGCSSICNCKEPNENCHKVNGACKSGCPPGKKPDNCQTQCDQGTFGDNCAYPCHCITATDCSVTGGRCSGLCEAGWMTAATATIANCQTKCPNGLFGIGCSGSCRCHDKAERCRYTDGLCGSGCQAGWQGQGCSRECDDGTFGVKCKLICNCKDTTEICDKENGDCKTGCPEGKYPPSCQSSCPAGLYGPNCKGECHCLDVANTCDGDNGTCMYGCAQGIGPICQRVENPATIEQSDGTGAIVGGSVGAVVLVIVVALAIVFIVRRKRKTTDHPRITDGHRNTRVKKDQYENANFQGDYVAPIPGVIQAKEEHDTDKNYYSSAEDNTYEVARDYYNTPGVQNDYQDVLGNKRVGNTTNLQS